MSYEPTVLLLSARVSFREALAFAIEQTRSFGTVTEIGNLREALAVEGSFDAVLLCCPLVDENCGDVVRALRRKHPASCLVVLVDRLGDDDTCVAHEAGANILLEQAAHLDEVFVALRTPRLETPAIEQDRSLAFLTRAIELRTFAYEQARLRDRLTRRELQILGELANGLSDRDIADRLAISVDTVRTHFARILEKLGVHTRIQALLVSLAYNLVELTPGPKDQVHRSVSSR